MPVCSLPAVSGAYSQPRFSFPCFLSENAARWCCCSTVSGLACIHSPERSNAHQLSFLQMLAQDSISPGNPMQGREALPHTVKGIIPILFPTSVLFLLQPGMCCLTFDLLSLTLTFRSLTLIRHLLILDLCLIYFLSF